MSIFEIRESHLKAIIMQQNQHMKALKGLNQIPAVTRGIAECNALIVATEQQLSELRCGLKNETYPSGLLLEV